VADGREQLSMTLVRSQMLSSARREVVEASSAFTILDQAFDGLVVFDAQVSQGSTQRAHLFLVSAIRISWSARLAFACWLLGSLFKTLAVCGPAALAAGVRPYLLDRLPEASRTVGDPRVREGQPRRFRSSSNSRRIGRSRDPVDEPTLLLALRVAR